MLNFILEKSGKFKSAYNWSVCLGILQVFMLLPFIAISQITLGDNLGNNQAGKDLNMNNFDISNAKIINGSGVQIGSASSLGNNVALRIDAINSTILIPRVPDILSGTLPSIPSANAVDGMIIYNNSDNYFYFRQSGAWKIFASAVLPSSSVYLGNSAGNVANTILSGDIVLSNTGVATLVDGAVKTSNILDLNVTPEKIAQLSLENRNFRKFSITNAKLAPKSVGSVNVIPGAPATVLTTAADGSAKWTSPVALGFLIGDIKPFFNNLGLPIPDGWLACDGTIITDAASPLNGKNLPNLNNSSYLVGGQLSDNGKQVGANTKTLAVDNLPVINLMGSSSAVSAGTVSGVIGLNTGGTHQHQYLDYYFNIPGNAYNNTGRADGDYMGNGSSQYLTTATASPALTHNHSATFSGITLPVHTHDALFPLNNVQNSVDITPKSIVTTWIMRIK